MQLLAPAIEMVPAPQFTQAEILELPELVLIVPARQGVHAAAPVDEVQVPGGHGLQKRQPTPAN